MAIQTLTIDIPDPLLGHLVKLDAPLSDLVLQALEQYVMSLNAQPAVVKNETWKLCGHFTIADTLEQSVDQPIAFLTNDAENVDDVLYGAMTIDG